MAVATTCALPLALDLPWQSAGGVVLLGLAGAVVPDYLDLRSDARALLRHRGVSHSLITGVLAIALAWLILGSLSQLSDPAVRLNEDLVRPLTIAFAIGVASHLALDACTPRGICPFLPLSRRRVWLLPRAIRITTGGRLDSLVGLASIASGAVVVALHVAQR